HGDVLVTDELTRLRTARTEAHSEDDVVQATLDQAEHFFAGTTAKMGGLRVVARELTLEETVDAAHLLFLAQTKTVLAKLDATLAVLAGRGGTARDRALLAEAALALEIELHAFAATELADGT